MKGLGYVDIGTRYKSGSTINWMRNEIRSLEEGVTLIIQTGINNILNTKQSNANLIHQYRQLLKENKNKNIIISSIIPASDRKGELYHRVFEVNEELRRIAKQEQVTFVDCEQAFIENAVLKFDLYKRAGIYLHLNEKGNELYVNMVDSVMRRLGIPFLTLSQVFWKTGPTWKRK